MHIIYVHAYIYSPFEMMMFFNVNVIWLQKERGQIQFHITNAYENKPNLIILIVIDFRNSNHTVTYKYMTIPENFVL